MNSATIKVFLPRGDAKSLRAAKILQLDGKGGCRETKSNSWPWSNA